MFKITQNYVIVFLKIIKRKQTSSTALKTIFSFSGRSEKMVFPKKSHWTMIFFVLSWKMIFLLPEKMILSPRRKIKDDLSQKNKQKTHTWEYDIFFRCSEKMVFSKKLQWNMIFLVLPGKMGFFSRKFDIFSLGGKWKMIFAKKHMEIWYFLYIRTGATRTTSRFPAKNCQRWSYQQKFTQRWLTF